MYYTTCTTLAGSQSCTTLHVLHWQEATHVHWHEATHEATCVHWHEATHAGPLLRLPLCACYISLSAARGGYVMVADSPCRALVMVMVDG